MIFLAPWTYPREAAARCVMNIFLAGGTGFIGGYLSRALARCGHKITLLVRSAVPAVQAERNIRFVTGNPSVRVTGKNIVPHMKQ